MIDLDVTITAVRRPEIFRLTASSFEKNLFRDAFKTRAILNVDPLGGSQADGAEVERIAKDFFPEVIVRHPEQGSFGDAVRWCWSQAKTPWVFHMEDDWLLLRKIRLDVLQQEMSESGVQGVRLFLRRNSADIHKRRISLNPSFLKLELIQRLLPGLDPALDPEKQLPGLPEGESIRNHGAQGAPRMVLDIGKKWRRAAGIEKRTRGANSVFARSGLGVIEGALLSVKRDYFIQQWKLFTALSRLRRPV